MKCLLLISACAFVVGCRVDTEPEPTDGKVMGQAYDSSYDDPSLAPGGDDPNFSDGGFSD